MLECHRKRFWTSLCPPLLLILVAVAAPAQAGNKSAQPAVPKAHPVIPGFERFFAAPAADQVKGGTLLLGELNCTSCHQPKTTDAKQAPILTDVGSRVKRSYLRKFLSHPQATKPGTAMPDMFAGLSEEERKANVEALLHLLAATGSPAHASPQPRIIDKGRQVYSQVGCVACHGSRDLEGNPQKVLPTSVPLGDLPAKYTIPSLTAFLADPLHARPSGRMPVLLKNEQAQQVAHYLLQSLPAPPANLTYTYYEGAWHKLPDFGKLQPAGKGKVNEFDVTVARRPNNFGLKFDGHLRIDREGVYKFFLTSDDGSKLRIDGKTVVNNDGEHAPQARQGSVKLTRGMHKLEVLFFQLGGGAELRVDVQGPGLPMQALAPLVFLTEQGNPKVVQEKNKEDEEFNVNPELVAKGREIFAGRGCASCHQLSVGGQAIAAKFPAKALTAMKAQGGCLSPTVHKGVPQFRLSKIQRDALAAAIAHHKTGPVLPKTGVNHKRETVAWHMTVFNCYACHQRDKIGGVEPELDAFFVTTQPEMGDEGRLPPPLNGVGAKLNAPYFKHILANGTHDRPYMLTNMPGFGAANTASVADLFASLDSVPVVQEIAFRETPGKVKAAARHLVGGTAFGCIKCHTFAGHKAEGVQGIDMTVMTARVRHDWFHYYLLNPQKYRPGTRMPTAFPDGETALKKILDGDANKQIEGMWLYLADGKRAALPKGLGQQFIELVPENEAIIYRNFIADAGPRAIAVGFPEKAHLAFDANNMRLALIWQGSFIDASRHWTDRGVGYQPPLGDSVLKLPNGPTFAVLDKATDPWPTKSSKELGYKFHGYRLTPDNRPTFLYTYNDVRIEDTPNAVEGPKQPFLRRTYTVTAPQAPPNLWLRAAVASKIESAGKGWYLINGTWRVHIEATAAPQVRQNGGNAELLVPVQRNGQQARIVQEYVW